MTPCHAAEMKQKIMAILWLAIHHDFEPLDSQARATPVDTMMCHLGVKQVLLQSQHAVFHLLWQVWQADMWQWQLALLLIL